MNLDCNIKDRRKIIAIMGIDTGHLIFDNKIGVESKNIEYPESSIENPAMLSITSNAMT